MFCVNKGAPFLLVEGFLKYWFVSLLAVFVGGFYWFPTTKILNNFFYAFILLPAAIFFFYTNRRTANVISFISTFSLLMVLVVCLFVSSIANGIEIQDVARELRRVLYVIGFLAVVKHVVEKKSGVSSYLLPFVLLAATTSGLYNIFLSYQNDAIYLRMSGFGLTENEVLLGSIYGFATLISIVGFISGRDRVSWLYAVPAIVTSAVLVFSQSRGPMLALVVCTVVALVIYRNRRSLLLLAVLLAVLSVVFSVFRESRIFSTGGLRPQIWQEVISLSLESPWLGHGLQAAGTIIIKNTEIHHAHNIFLATFYHGGLLGLASLLLLQGGALLGGQWSADTILWRLVLGFGVVCMLFDAPRLFSHPTHLWLVLWLPIGVLAARTVRKPAP